MLRQPTTFPSVSKKCTGTNKVFVSRLVMLFVPQLNGLLCHDAGADGIGSHYRFVAVGADDQQGMGLAVFNDIIIPDEVQNVSVLVTKKDIEAGAFGYDGI